MQHSIQKIMQLVFIALVALVSSSATLIISGAPLRPDPSTVLSIAVVALAAFVVQSAVGELAFAGYVLRWLMDPRAAAEGLWIERVNPNGDSGGVTYSLISIEYNSAEDIYYIHIWNFDERGRELRWLTSSQIDFGAGNKRILYEYDGHRLIRDTICVTPAGTASAASPIGSYAQDCHGFGSLVFCRSRFGKYTFARGRFIDCSLKTVVSNGALGHEPSQMRSIVLRRIRNREIISILSKNEDTRDPMPRMRGGISFGQYKGPYKNHDLARIALAYWHQANCQDKDLAQKAENRDCDRN